MASINTVSPSLLQVIAANEHFYRYLYSLPYCAKLFLNAKAVTSRQIALHLSKRQKCSGPPCALGRSKNGHTSSVFSLPQIHLSSSGHRIALYLLRTIKQSQYPCIHNIDRLRHVSPRICLKSFPFYPVVCAFLCRKASVNLGIHEGEEMSRT